MKQECEKHDSEVFCTNCGWEGRTKQLNGIKCPSCNEGRFINDCYEEWQGYDNQILGDSAFNWNRK